MTRVRRGCGPVVAALIAAHATWRLADEEIPADGPRSDAGPEPGAARHGPAHDPPPDARVRGALHGGAARARADLPDANRRRAARLLGDGGIGGGRGEHALRGRHGRGRAGGEVRRALGRDRQGLRSQRDRAGGPLRADRARRAGRRGPRQGAVDQGRAHPAQRVVDGRAPRRPGLRGRDPADRRDPDRRRGLEPGDREPRDGRLGVGRGRRRLPEGLDAAARARLLRALGASVGPGEDLHPAQVLFQPHPGAGVRREERGALHARGVDHRGAARGAPDAGGGGPAERVQAPRPARARDPRLRRGARPGVVRQGHAEPGAHLRPRATGRRRREDRRRVLEDAQHHDRRRAGGDEGPDLPPRAHGVRGRVRHDLRPGGARAGAGRARGAGRLRGERAGRPEGLRREAVKRVLVTDGLSPVGVDYLRKEGLEVETVPTLAEAELVARLRGLHGLIVRSATRVTRAVVEAGPDLVVIGRAGAGVDNIDVDAATERGVIVMNTPGGNTIAVAEHTIGLLLALARNLPQAHGALKAGRWEKSRYAGVVGLGRIGSEVARRALGLSLKVIAYDPYLPREAAERLGVESVELDDLFQRSDFISIHTPLSKDTRNFIDEAQFARMKAGVRIINCARGGVVNEAALAAAIRAGRVGGAALDVFEQEPLPAGHPLLGLDQVIVTPHLAASTEEAQSTVALAIAEQVAAALLRGMVLNAVNMPSADAETLRELAPYFTLAERLGSFLAQLAEGRMAEARLAYGGGLAEQPTDALKLAFLRGLLNVILEERVTDVNAPLVARARGLRVVETSG